MAESAQAGPSSPRLKQPISPSKGNEAMDVDVAETGSTEMGPNGDSHGPASPLVNATTLDTLQQSEPTPTTSATTSIPSLSRMDPPPDTMRPPSRGTDTPNGVHFAATTESITESMFQIERITELDQAMSPAQSIAGSITTTKSRNKRKRGPAGSARRASTVDKDRPDHYLGPENQTIRCICGTQAEGLTAQCDRCGAWEHALCFGYTDEDSLPENFYCELCDPRPVDGEKARAMQLRNMDQIVMTAENDLELDLVKPRPKGKRQKSEVGPNDGNDPSPTTPKPPSLPAKPKRRPAGAKPRSVKASITDTAPSPAAAAASSRAVASEAGKELDDPFFREPWTMQFSPLKKNLPKGWRGESVLKRLYADWRNSDVDEGDLNTADRPSRERSTSNVNDLSMNTLDLTDLSTLAAPVPPVDLLGPDLDDLAAPISVRPVRDSVNFLPGQYEGDLSPDDLSHPSNYGVYARSEVPPGTFIGEFRGEIGPSEAYRRDAYNQYDTLGIPKPHVRTVGPPLNLAIDARCWGTRLRFIRSSCHPNAVLRLIRWRATESDLPQIGLGVFANTTIRSRGEITLSWDWDDRHLVHTLEQIIEAASSDDATAFVPRDETAASLADKCDTVLLAMYGIFATCACTNPNRCAFQQMKYIVDHREETEARHRFGSAQGRNPGSELGELIGAVRGFRRQPSPVARVRRRSPGGWGMQASTTPAVPSVERDEPVSEGEEQIVGQESMEVDVEEPVTLEQPSELVQSPDEDVDMDRPKEDLQDTLMDTNSPKLDTTLPTISETSPLRIPPRVDADDTPGSPVDDLQELPKAVNPSSIASVASSVLSAAPSQDIPEVSTEPMETPMPEVADDDGNESDATTATLPRSHFSDSEPETEDDRPPTPPRRSQTSESKEEEPAQVNGALQSKDQSKPSHLQDLFENDTDNTRKSISPAPSASTLNDDTEIVAEAPAADSPPRRVKVTPAPRGRPRLAKNKKDNNPAKTAKGRRVVRESGSRSRSPVKSASKVEIETIEKRKPESEPEAVKISTPEPEVPRESSPEPTKEPSPEPAKEPTPPPPPPPKHKVPIAEYLRLAKQRREEKAKPAEIPAAPPTPTAVVAEPIATASAPAPDTVNLSVENVADGGIPGFRHMSPLKPVDPLPIANGASASPATRQAELDAARFNMFDHLPSHGSASQTPALETPTNGSTTTTPGLGLTKGDYFPQQPPAQSQISSSYVPRASRPVYVPRAQGSISRTSESPSIDDYLPKPSGPSSAQSQSAPLPRVPSGSSSYVPRPSPLSDHAPLPSMSMSMSQSNSSSSSNYPNRISPYRASSALPAEPSIPPPAIREPPPHATFRPPTGPKVPPKGPRTSGGSASGGGGFPPPRDRDRDQDARDRDRERDNRDRDVRDRERERERDREPVSPRATFGIGSARGGAPVPVPFHRGRGRGMFRGGGRGGWPQSQP